jgi:hypothetical protein
MNRQVGLRETAAVVLVLFSGLGVAHAQASPPAPPQHPGHAQQPLGLTQPPEYAEPAYAQTEQDRGDAKPSAPTKLPKFSVPIRPALLLQGKGEVDDSCDGECTGIATGSTDFQNHLTFGLNVDFMGTVGRLVRLGLGFFYVAPYGVDLESVDENYEFGSDLSMNFVFELTPRIAPGVWLVPRVQAGFTLLFPAGDFADELERLADLCEAASLGDCGKIEGMKPGLNLGVGFGGVFAVSESLALRADLLLQGYVINLFTLEPDTPDATLSRNIAGHRFFVLAGVEL